MWIGDILKMVSNANPKNEIVYTPSTMAEWTIGGAGTTKGNGTIHLVQASFNDAASIVTGLKSSTNYGLLYSVSGVTLDNNFVVTAAGAISTATIVPKNLGNCKAVVTTFASIAVNTLPFACVSGNTDGTYIDFGSVRLFELPSGSQIESDFTNLTADQLNTLYPM